MSVALTLSKFSGNCKKAEKDSSFLSAFKIIISFRIKESASKFYAEIETTFCIKGRVHCRPSKICVQEAVSVQGYAKKHLPII